MSTCSIWTARELERLQAVLASLAATEGQNVTNQEPLDGQALAKTLSELRGPLGRAEQDGILSNVFDALKLGSDELRNANALAWFMRAANNHGLGSDLLNSIVRDISEASGRDFPLSTGQCLIGTEVNPEGQTTSRVDLMLDDPGFFIIVEVKIRAGEQPEQIARYCEIAARRAGSRPWAVVFLTPDGRPTATASAWEESVLRMPWSKIAAMLEEVVSDRERTSVSAYLATGFARHIRTNIARPLWREKPTVESQELSSFVISNS